MTFAECLAAAEQTKCMIVEDGTLSRVPALLKEWFPGKAAVFVFDNNTWAAAGKKIIAEMEAQNVPIADMHNFFNELKHAEYRHIETLKKKFDSVLGNLDCHAPGCNSIVPVAVGSGTINDLVKRAAGELGLPYFCVPTAASVDGFTAYSAAILRDGFKQTLTCPAPVVVAADTAVLAAAPAYLTSSGFGDLAGKIVAGCDWIIADKLCDFAAPGTQKIDAKAWEMVQGPLKENLAASVNAAKGDREAVKILFEGLGVTGFALQYMKDSRAVSGCEHMWSHVWEMENLSVGGVPVTHGHKVAMGTLAACAFAECLFAQNPGRRSPRETWAEREASIRKSFAELPLAAEAACKTSKEKFIEPGSAHAKQIEEGIFASWDYIKKAVAEKMPPFAELRAMLAKALCPVEPKEINLTKERIIAAARSSQMIRNRFTVLDLAYEAGMFEETLKRMENSILYFSQSTQSSQR